MLLVLYPSSIELFISLDVYGVNLVSTYLQNLIAYDFFLSIWIALKLDF